MIPEDRVGQEDNKDGLRWQFFTCSPLLRQRLGVLLSTDVHLDPSHGQRTLSVARQQATTARRRILGQAQRLAETARCCRTRCIQAGGTGIGSSRKVAH